MKYIQGKEKEWEHNPGYEKKVLREWNQWNKIQEIVIPPHETAKLHYHTIQTEIFYFLTENGYRIVNGEKIIPVVWDVLIIEPNDKHTVVNETDDEYRYLAFKVDYVDDDLYRE
jgi:quercetin dioxygenase-like cupin family protein